MLPSRITKYYLYHVKGFRVIFGEFWKIILNSICPCIASISLKYNQQDATFPRSIYFYKLLYIFQAVSPPIIRSTKLYIQCRVLSNQYRCLLLSWMRWNCVFPRSFLGCKANARVKPVKTGHGLHTSKIFVLFYILFALCRSVYYLCKCVLYYCHRVATQLQLINISYYLFHLSPLDQHALASATDELCCGKCYLVLINRIILSYLYRTRMWTMEQGS